jgi:hypothetical protein
MSADEPKSLQRRKIEKLLITFEAFSIGRDDRIALAETLLHRPNDRPPITSFNDLTDHELDRMLDAMAGAALVAHLCLDRRAGRKPAWCRPAPSPLGGQVRSR